MKRREELVGKIGKILVKTKALQFGTFSLPSGRLSSYYIDLRMTPSLPDAFRLMVDAYIETANHVLNSDHFEAIGAIPTVGLTYAAVVAYRLAKPLLYVRGEGTRPPGAKSVEGILMPGSNVLVIDDLSMTGTSILKAAQSIRSEGGVVSDALVLIDRMEGAAKLLRTAQIRLRSFTTILELARVLRQMEALAEEDFQSIRKQVTSR